MNDDTVQHQRDWLSSPWKTALFWGLPWALIIIGANTDQVARTALWTVAFSGAGLACLVNARRCRRRHCFYTGPLFLLAAIASLLYGIGLLPLGTNGWNWIGGGALVGSFVLCCGLEKRFGKYVTERASDKGWGAGPG